VDHRPALPVADYYTHDGLLLFIEVEDLADVKERLDGADGVAQAMNPASDV